MTEVRDLVHHQGHEVHKEADLQIYWFLTDLFGVNSSRFSASGGFIADISNTAELLTS